MRYKRSRYQKNRKQFILNHKMLENGQITEAVYEWNPKKKTRK